MVLFEEFLPYIPFWNLLFFVAGVPICLFINNKTRSDLICIILGIAYMIVYGFFLADPQWDDWFFFVLGLIVGYVTDFVAVKAKKWKYHTWDPDYGYSWYVGFAWGMVTMFTYNIGSNIPSEPLALVVTALIFVSPMFICEYKFGETRRDQYFLYARVLFTFLAFYNNLGLLFIAIFVGTYIEWVGVFWLKNWLYIDTMSFLFLSGGYSLMILTAKIIVDLLGSTPIEPLVFIFFFLAILFYMIDTFYEQKRVVDKYSLNESEKAALAAKDFNKID